MAGGHHRVGSGRRSQSPSPRNMSHRTRSSRSSNHQVMTLPGTLSGSEHRHESRQASPPDTSLRGVSHDASSRKYVGEHQEHKGSPRRSPPKESPSPRGSPRPPLSPQSPKAMELLRHCSERSRSRSGSGSPRTANPPGEGLRFVSRTVRYTSVGGRPYHSIQLALPGKREFRLALVLLLVVGLPVLYCAILCWYWHDNH